MPLQAPESIDPSQRVVVGQRYDFETCRDMGGDDLRRWQLAVAEDGVQVQVRPAVGYLCQWSPILCGTCSAQLSPAKPGDYKPAVVL